jgi:hypothetical protein
MTDIVKAALRRWLTTVPDQIVSGIASPMMSAVRSSLPAPEVPTFRRRSKLYRFRRNQVAFGCVAQTVVKQWLEPKLDPL